MTHPLVPPIPFDAVRLRRLLAWAEGLCPEEEDPEDDERFFMAWEPSPPEPTAPLAGFRLASEAAMFVATALAAAHPQELALVEELQSDAAEWDRWVEDHPTTAAQALAVWLRCAPLAPGEALRQSGHERALVREAAVGKLQLDDPGERARLEELATDPDRRVREAAAARLGRDVPWWAAAFERDPLAGAASDAAATAAARALVAAVTAPGALDAAGATRSLAALPAAARVAPARRLFEAHGHEAGAEALLVPFLADPGSLAAVFGRDQYRSGARALARLWPTLGEEGGPLLAGLARWVLAQPEAVRRERDGALRSIADHVGQAWTADLDASFALEAAQQDPPSDWRNWDPAPFMARKLLERGALADAVLDGAAEALLAGWPAPWTHAGGALAAALLRLPPDRLGPLARRAFEAPIADPNADQDARRRCRAWAVGALLGPLLDEPIADAATRLWEHPEVRDAVFSRAASAVPFLAPLRRALRSGTDLETAACAMRAVGDAFGGLWRPFMPELYQGAAHPPPEHHLPPPELRGPATPEEWAAWRALRDAATGEDMTRGLDALPPPPWGAADRAYIRRIVDRALQGEDRLCHISVWLLAGSRDKADLPLLDEVVLREPDAEARATLLRRRREAWEDAGMRPPPLPGEPGQAAPAPEEEDPW